MHDKIVYTIFVHELHFDLVVVDTIVYFAYLVLVVDMVARTIVYFAYFVMIVDLVVDTIIYFEYFVLVVGY